MNVTMTINIPFAYARVSEMEPVILEYKVDPRKLKPTILLYLADLKAKGWQWQVTPYRDDLSIWVVFE